MQTRRLRNSKGITLVELILVIAVLGIVSAAALSFFVFGLNTFAMSSSQTKVQQEARLATTVVGQELRTSINVRVFADRTAADTDADAPYTRCGLHTRESGQFSPVFSNVYKTFRIN
jgi:prepilin-type N-terminal cleavage/methylation domain-containing protein